MHSRSSTIRTGRAVGAVAALLAGGLVLGACSGGGGDDKTGKESSPSAGGSVSLPKLDGAHLEIAAVWTGQEQTNFKKVLAEFEKRTGAPVTVVPAQDPLINLLG